MSGWTEGEWKASFGGVFAVYAAGEVIVEADGSCEEDRANLNLISAAPELYEALQEILDEVLESEIPHKTFCRARAALTKAEGR